MVKKNTNNVTGNVQSSLVELSNTSGLPIDDIQAIFNEATQLLTEKKVKGNTEVIALNLTKNQVRKLTKKAEFTPKATATGIVGFIIGDSGLWDKIEQIRRKAKSHVDKYGLQAAVEENLINADNQVLDTRKKIFGKDNPNYLEPLNKLVNGKLIKAVDKTRTLHLIARINGDKQYKYGTMQTNDPSLAVAWGKVKFFTPCQTFGIVKENPEGVNGFKLNSSQAEETMSIFKAVKEDMDVDKIFLETISAELTPVGEVEKFHEAYKDVYGATIFVKGMVAWINRDRPSPFGDIKMGLLDPETGEMVTVSIPEYINSEFGESSTIVVFGRTKRQDLRVEGEDGKVSWAKGKGDVAIAAVGTYGVKGLLTPVDLTTKPETLDDEKEIEGWLD